MVLNGAAAKESFLSWSVRSRTSEKLFRLSPGTGLVPLVAGGRHAGRWWR